MRPWSGREAGREISPFPVLPRRRVAIVRRGSTTCHMSLSAGRASRWQTCCRRSAWADAADFRRGRRDRQCPPEDPCASAVLELCSLPRRPGWRHARWHRISGWRHSWWRRAARRIPRRHHRRISGRRCAGRRHPRRRRAARRIARRHHAWRHARRRRPRRRAAGRVPGRRHARRWHARRRHA